MRRFFIAAFLVAALAASAEADQRDPRLPGLFDQLKSAASLEAAVERAYLIAREMGGPATVLLSPAATSFDMFADYAARGDAFKRIVGELGARR